MKMIRSFLALSAAIIALSLVNVNAQSFSGSTTRSGNTIERQIYKKIIALPNYGVFDYITFQVQGDTVVLSGKVYSLGTKSLAPRAVGDVPGVRRVVNNIQDLPVGSFDNTIRRDALGTFSNHGLGGYFWEPNPEVHIIVENGHVTLEGNVYSTGDYNSMNILANGVPGVFSVTNHLVVGKEEYR